MKIKGFILSLFLFTGAVGFTKGPERMDEPVIYAGFGYITSYGERQYKFPYTEQIDLPRLRKKLRKIVASTRPPNYKLSLSGRLKNASNGLTLACTLDGERVIIEKVGGRFKIVVALSAQILVFDFSQKKILATFPFGVQVVDVQDNEPKEEYLRSVIHDLYFGGRFKTSTGGPLNFGVEFSKKLKSQVLKNRYGHHMQVCLVDVSEKVKNYEFVPDHFKGRDFRLLKSEIAHQFTKYFSEQNSVGMLPFTVSGFGKSARGLGKRTVASAAIKRTMGLKLENGNFNFKIPVPDYGIYLRLEGLKKFELKKGSSHAKSYSSYRNLGYACLLDVAVRDPIDDSFPDYFSGKIKAVKIRQVSSSSVESDWPWFQYAMIDAYRNLSDFARESDRKKTSSWLANYTTGIEMPELKALSELIGKSQ
jgi:hypothetical protein